MSEPSHDLDRWRLVSLITALRAVLLHGPDGDDGGPVSRVCPDGQERLAFAHAVMDELTDRGLDGESLVRYGLFPEILAPVLGSIITAQLLGEEEVTGLRGRPTSIDIKQWRRVFGFNEEASETIGGLLDNPSVLRGQMRRVFFDAFNDVTSTLGPLMEWISVAAIDDIFVLRAPATAEMESAASDAPGIGQDLYGEYRWIVDRFSTTFFSQWGTNSLHNEYKWIQGTGSPPCSVELMRQRVIDRPEIEPEIARRAVHQPHPDQSSVDRLAYQVNNHARAFLREGRSREAAALFEFVCREEPENADAQNNLGFCLIPNSPGKALRWLEKAGKLGYPHAVINTYNKMCCHLAMGRHRAAIREAEDFWARSEEDAEATSATLWFPGAAGEWVLEETRDARAQLARLAAHIGRIEAGKRTAASGLSTQEEEAESSS